MQWNDTFQSTVLLLGVHAPRCSRDVPKGIHLSPARQSTHYNTLKWRQRYFLWQWQWCRRGWLHTVVWPPILVHFSFHPSPNDSIKLALLASLIITALDHQRKCKRAASTDFKCILVPVQPCVHLLTHRPPPWLYFYRISIQYTS